MKILVPIKRVIDYRVKIRVKPDQSGVVDQQVKMSMNPFDEIALEEAIRLKEIGIAQEIIAVSIGNKASEETLITALALGADRAMLLETENEYQPLAIAKLLKAVVEEEKPSLVIMGKQAIDNDCNQVGQMLAGLLNWAQGTFAAEVNVDAAKKEVTVKREVDAGEEVVKLNLPAVITADLRLNKPRYVSLPNLMQAKRKTIETKSVEIPENTSIQVLKVTEPPQRKPGVILNDVDELLGEIK